MREGTSHLARCHSESASTRTISAEGSLSSRQIRTAPQRERFDTHDLRRGFAELKTNSHGATARALRHARSPQRVRRAQDKFARRHSQSASTSTMRPPRKMHGSLTECCAGHGILRQHTNPKIGAAPQRSRETTFCDNCHGFRAPIVQAW